MMNESPRRRYTRHWDCLKSERKPYLDHWRELADYLGARRPRFLTTDRTKSRKNSLIINSSPLRARRVLASGMMAGVTSPARPWFRLATPDPGLNVFGSVRNWLYAVENTMRMIYAKSNIYNGLHGIYDDLGVFGTSAMLVEDDDEDVIRGYGLPIGQYALANSPRLNVNTVYRELSMTVIQLVERFGLHAVSPQVRQMYEKGDYYKWVDLLHVIEPNREYSEGMLGPYGFQFSSAWLELGRADDVGLLHLGGYHEFPLLCPRWGVTAEDPYGFSPGMDALGDCKALQEYEKEKAKMVQKTVQPPMGGPTSLMNRRVSLLPGDFTPVDVTAGGQKLEPLLAISPLAFDAMRNMIEVTERRIDVAFFLDLWMMMAETDRREITAREVAERHEEKMLQLGPVMERLQDELLDPLIDRTFGILLRKGLVPPPPPELQGMTLKVEYISILAQAQKLLGVNSIERFSSYVVQAAGVRPDILDVVDWDAGAREYADAIGAPPTMLMDAKQVERMRQERAAQQQAAREAEMLNQASQGVKNLSQSSVNGSNALEALSQAYSRGPTA